ncbi:MAG: 2-oxoacid:acceptor oxidoreductase family protein [Desulfohalobiaceae bacterium]|nr:2-oxoacid:acceptor oxidoreductase family protein [Desulfohalobiaceae bacterium]
MASLLNTSRPPVFCPGCAHERVVRSLDRAFVDMDLCGEDIAIVSDIGCSGLFDTFFKTHALHGLHGRALTYATGLKLARPELTVVVTMGDGGLGIGGAHVLSACRRNLDLTLLVLNNFNYGMTGGQCSTTTPTEAVVGSGFLNRLEKPMEICEVAGAAGAPFVRRLSAYQKDLAELIQEAVRFQGFSLLDIRGLCPGRYTKRNKQTPGDIQAELDRLPDVTHFAEQNRRLEYGVHYRREAKELEPVQKPVRIEAGLTPPESGRQEVVVLGSAGQRIVTAGELLGLAGMSAGLHATQKNDYPITVMKGHSISELVLSSEEIGYTGLDRPSVVVALGPEGVARRKGMLQELPGESLILAAKGLELPGTEARVMEVDFKALQVKSQDFALASLALLAAQNRVLSLEMLKAALSLRFKKGKALQASLDLVERLQRTTP